MRFRVEEKNCSFSFFFLFVPTKKAQASNGEGKRAKIRDEVTDLGAFLSVTQCAIFLASWTFCVMEGVVQRARALEKKIPRFFCFLVHEIGRAHV